MDFARQHVGQGQGQLADHMKQLVSSVQSPIVELLDYSDDAPFLDPSLFGYFAKRQSGITLEQILYGYLTDGSLLARISAYADHRGLVFLPRLGYLWTNAADSLVTIEPHAERRDFYVREGPAASVHLCRLDELHSIKGTEIDLCIHSDPLLESIFRDGQGERIPFEIDRTDRIVTALNLAFEILYDVAPVLLKCSVAVTRRIVLFRAEKFESFATASAHGSAFLKIAPPYDVTEVFFVEDIVHQCGHVLFSSLTFNREEFLRVAPDTPLQEITGAESDHRDLYTAFHGVFTEALMCIALYECLKADVFRHARLHELWGRLSFVMKRFHLDLLNLNRDGLFTDRGLVLLREFGRTFDEVFRNTREGIAQFDLSNQPYAFNYERFVKLNPL